MPQVEFPNYTQLEPRLPQWFWMGLRIIALLFTLYLIYILFTRPDYGLTLFWRLIIPLLPLSFAVVPGLWRNICPMAFLNQLPRLTGVGLQRTLPPFAANMALLISIVLFMSLIVSRELLLNYSGLAVGILLIVVLSLALVGGFIFKGRSGWCGTFCPLAPIQKVYGHAPLMTVRNGYCEHCVGCQKNCYDFNPRAAIFSDLNSSDSWWADKRKYFAAMLPGLIIGYYNTIFVAGESLTEYYLSILVPPLLTVGLYHTLKNLFNLGDYRLTSLFGLSALGIFYYFGAPIFLTGLEDVFNLTFPDYVSTVLRLSVLVISLAVLARGLLAERAYLRSDQASSQASVGRGVHALKAAIEASEENAIVLERSSGKRFNVDPGHSLLDALEDAELPIMSGCRMGMCGSDPVVIVDGNDELEPPDENELTTLRRLGYEGKARLACCCRPKGKIEIDLSVRPEDVESGLTKTALTELELAEDQKRVIIIGNGIAGISTAESIREIDNDIRITLISEEPHHFYNRMGLERVVHGQSAMQGLYLMNEDWYKRSKIDVWLNTRVSSIERKNKQVELGNGELLDYDKLVLATGGKAFRPPIPGVDTKGCFVLRDAADALAMRAWVQGRYRCKFAVVLGGGVLGVEAAYALRQLGLKVTIVNSSHQLMNRQMDLQAAVILKKYLSNGGIDVILDSGIQSVKGGKRIKQVELNDGSSIEADMLLICTGVRPNIELANSVGLDINRGVLVDAQMRSSDPDIFCVGDVAEMPGAISGLWSVGNEQGKVAASSILGLTKVFEKQSLPPIQLKVDGIDLVCFGSFGSFEGTESYTQGDIEKFSWKHLIVKDDKLIAGVFVNNAMSANKAVTAMKKQGQLFSRQVIDEIIEPPAVNR